MNPQEQQLKTAVDDTLAPLALEELDVRLAAPRAKPGDAGSFLFSSLHRLCW